MVAKKLIKPNKCGAKVNLQLLQDAGKSYEGKGPVNKGIGSKVKK